MQAIVLVRPLRLRSKQIMSKFFFEKTKGKSEKVFIVSGADSALRDDHYRLT